MPRSKAELRTESFACNEEVTSMHQDFAFCRSPVFFCIFAGSSRIFCMASAFFPTRLVLVCIAAVLLVIGAWYYEKRVEKKADKMQKLLNEHAKMRKPAE